MNREILKQRVCSEIDAHRQELIALGKQIWNAPEPGYEEVKTAKAIAEVFESLNLPVQKGLAVTGVRADLDTGRQGPVVALLGELDALVMNDNPEAKNGAAHACGHNGQIVMLAGAAFGLAGILEHLSGRVALIACPAEECRIIRRDDVRFFGGKQELIRLGVFDDVDLAMMTHANSEYLIAESSNGFVMKKVVFHGKAAHAGGRPWAGINALSAARIGLAALDAQRDTFRDEDAVRIHGIIVKGGSTVNIVPEQTELEYQIRAKTPEAVKDASEKFDRAMRAGAVALGTSVTITTYPGYMPLRNDPDLAKIHDANLAEQVPGTHLTNCGHRGSSTDFGDITMIMPACHPYTTGWKGTVHAVDFKVTDEEKAYVEPAKLMACDIIDLLYGDAEEAKKIAKKTPPFTKEQYLAFLESMDSVRTYHG